MSDEETPAAAMEEPTSDREVERLRREGEAAEQRAQDLLDQLRRARADYLNLQKRSEREAEEVRETANGALLVGLLPVLDDFDHAVAALPEGPDATGIRLLRDNLWHVLREAGLVPIDPVGMPFDPYDHEVVGQASDESLSDGTVRDVVQKGYRYRRRLLRPAKVIVVKRGAENGENHRN